jgi:hypothetical protein
VRLNCSGLPSEKEMGDGITGTYLWALSTMVSDSQPTTDPYNKVVTVILRRPDSLFLLPLNGAVLGTVLFELL